MTQVKNIRRISLEKKIKETKEIQNFLKNQKEKDKIISIIDRNTSRVNREYFQAESLLSIFENPIEDPIKKAKKLLKLKQKYLTVSLLEEYGFLSYISLIEEKYEDDFSKEKFFDFFVDFQDIKKMKSDYSKSEHNFLLECKVSLKKYSTALNEIDVEHKLEKLEKALMIAPWGSIEAIRIIQAIILIENGKKLGKNPLSLEREERNNKKQRKVV